MGGKSNEIVRRLETSGTRRLSAREYVNFCTKKTRNGRGERNPFAFRERRGFVNRRFVVSPGRQTKNTSTDKRLACTVVPFPEDRNRK